MVKSAFSIFIPNSSHGVNYSYNNEIIDTKAEYEKNITKSIGRPALKMTDLITIKNNGIHITEDCSISYVMSKSPGFPSEFPIKTNTAAIYNIEYVITYKGIDVKASDGNNIKQTIEIK